MIVSVPPTPPDAPFQTDSQLSLVSAAHMCKGAGLSAGTWEPHHSYSQKE